MHPSRCTDPTLPAASPPMLGWEQGVHHHVQHRPTVADEGPLPGDTIVIGDHAMEILAVGEVVSDNLLNLGHLDLKADGLTEPKLPGDVCVAPQPLPLLKAGDDFKIVRAGTTEVAS